MDLNRALDVVEAQAALMEARIETNGSWLTRGFLADDAFSPQSYLARARQQKDLRRALFALNELLVGQAAVTAVA
jgi:hypothetical protein